MTPPELAQPLEIRVEVHEEADVGVARRVARDLALRQGLSETDATALATAVSEIARNIVVHAGTGEVRFGRIAERDRRGVLVVARDESPGIADLDAAMRDGYSTRQGLGLGLPSARRLVDEFALASAVGSGTSVVLKKWARRAGGAGE